MPTYAGIVVRVSFLFVVRQKSTHFMSLVKDQANLKGYVLDESIHASISKV